MKPSVVLCLAGGLVAAMADAQPPEPKPAPLTKEQQEKLKERDRFEKEARQLRAEGKLPEAIAAAEKMQAIERQVFGNVRAEVAGSLELLAELHEAREDFPAACQARQEVLAIHTKRLGAQHWQVTDARLALEDVDRLARMEPANRRRLNGAEQLSSQAVQLYQQGKTRAGIPLAEKAAEIRKQVLGERHADYAQSLNNLAALYRAQGEFARAEPLFRQAVAIAQQTLGECHPAYAISLNNLADLYLHQGKSAKAEPLYRQALEICRQALGERDPAYATSLNNLADLYREQGAYAKAEPLYRQALELRKQVQGERHPDYATSLNNLAALYQDQGKYAQAELLYRQALEIKKQVLGPRHPAYARALNNLAVLRKAQGDYARAELLYRQALEIRKQALGEHHPDYANSLNNLATLYQAQAEYAKAEPLFRQASDIYKQVLGERHPNYALSLTNLAELYRSRGEYAKVEPLYREVLDIYKEARGERHPACATSLNNLALLYSSQGEYAKAEPLYRQALDIFKQALGEHHPDYARGLHNLAGLYLAQGAYARAEPMYRQALAIRKQVLGERHPDYAGGLNDLAALYQAQGEYGKAEPLYRQALDLRKQALGPGHPDYAASLSNLAVLHQDQGAYAQAEPLYRQALESKKQALGERHPDYAQSLNNLATLYRAQGAYARAEPLYRQAIAALRQRPEDPLAGFEQLTATDLRPLPGSVTCLANYCHLIEQCLGSQPTIVQLRAADHAFGLALAVRERLRQEVLEQDASKLHHGAEAVDLIPRRIGLCQRLFEREGRAADLETALAVAEQGSARVFLEQLGKARALTVGRVSLELRTEEADLRRQLWELDMRIAKEQDKPSDQRDPDKVGQLLDQRRQVESQRDALIRRMEKEYPQYAALKYPRPCVLAEARACLAANEVALLFVPGQRKSYVVLVEARPAPADKAHGLAVYSLPARDDIADGISLLTDRDFLERPQKARAAGQQAYDLLLAPLKERLRGKDLPIVPGGPLGYLPFEALVEDDRFLIENHRIRYAPSLTAVHLVRLWEKTRPDPQRPLWALADPVYDRADKRVAGKAELTQATQDALAEYLRGAERDAAAGGPFARLRFTGKEAQSIRACLAAAEADVLTGVQATEAAVKAASAKGLLAQARYVHFATHGILGVDTGQPAALVLSLVGNDGEHDTDGGINDGFLRLDEVTRLKLNADLVVLSACETGKGRLYAGEGVTGLARAFLYAGSRGVVCSLWAVDDRETAALMTRLYGGLKDGQRAADALRAAKLAMIRAGKAPVYWAPFILIGE
jgi:CHAT domain-containing protein/Tfp pilus assembly protein PilF